MFTGVTPGPTSYEIQLILRHEGRLIDFMPVFQIQQGGVERTQPLVNESGDEIGLSAKYSYLPQSNIGYVGYFQIYITDQSSLAAQYYAQNLDIQVSAYNSSVIDCAARLRVRTNNTSTQDFVMCSDGSIATTQFNCIIDNTTDDGTFIP
jgi:hypothetical protein